jgi:hypothetical protein
VSAVVIMGCADPPESLPKKERPGGGQATRTKSPKASERTSAHNTLAPRLQASLEKEVS